MTQAKPKPIPVEVTPKPVPVEATPKSVPIEAKPVALQPRPAPLPQKIEDWERKIKSGLTLNDHVETIHLALWVESQEYRAFLEAVWDSEAVEGSLSIDTTMAAMLLRDKAKTVDGNPVSHKNLDTVKKSLGVVLRRYGNDRRERRHTVGGQVVPGNNDVE